MATDPTLTAGEVDAATALLGRVLTEVHPSRSLFLSFTLGGKLKGNDVHFFLTL
jgi:hypothetical protein